MQVRSLGAGADDSCKPPTPGSCEMQVRSLGAGADDSCKPPTPGSCELHPDAMGQGGSTRKRPPKYLLGGGKIRVLLRHAVNLGAMNSDGTSDPYVELSAFGVVGSESLGEVHRKSQMRSKTVDPVWDEVLEFETTDLRRTLEQPLRLQVVNHHRLRKGDDLGTANLDLRVLASYCPEALPHSVAHVPHTVVAGETLYEGWYASFERVTTAACKCSPRRPLLPTGTRASRGCRCIGRAAAARA